MVERLSILYELQLIDNILDELEELRGDLPMAVNNLKEHIQEKQELIEEKKGTKKENAGRITENEEEMQNLAENLTKYKAQLYKVRNNKEYDALTKEIDHAEITMRNLEHENNEIENFMGILSNQIEDIEPEVEELNEDLVIKEEELAKIIDRNQKEEAKLSSEREKLVEQIRKSDYNNYMRIRKAKGGIAIASIHRAACDGCHSIVPPQRQLEVKQNKRIYTCESCGRLIISAEITDSVKEKFSV